MARFFFLSDQVRMYFEDWMGNMREELRLTSRFLVCIIRLELLFKIAGGLYQEFNFGYKILSSRYFQGLPWWLTW